MAVDLKNDGVEQEEEEEENEVGGEEEVVDEEAEDEVFAMVFFATALHSSKSLKLF